MAWKPAALAAALAGLAAFPAASGAVAVAAHTVDVDVAMRDNYIRVDSSAGTVAFNLADNSVTTLGTIACMTVRGNEAYIVYRDTLRTAPRNGTVGGYLRIRDNGAATGGPVDEQNNGRATLRALNREIAKGCPIPTSGAAFHRLHTVTEGEITIT